MRVAPAVVLVAGLLLGGGPARAQLTAAPESLRVALRPGEEATAAIALANATGSALRYCLDFEEPARPRVPTAGRGAGTCGQPGGRLFHLDQSAGIGWDPLSLAMTPEGRLFVADFTANRLTWELTADLQLVRYFPHPTVAELAPFPHTVGVTYNEDTGTLWWTNSEESEDRLERVLLLEGSLDGVPTGRRIEIPVPPDKAPRPGSPRNTSR